MELSTAQENYFKNSRVREPDGSLAVAYHGAGTTITQFDPAFTGGGNDQYGSGFYFTSDQNTAKGYTTAHLYGDDGKLLPKPGGEDNPNVISAYLNITNPYIVDGRENANMKSISFTPGQTLSIIRRLPSLYFSQESEKPNPLGDYFVEYWNDGLTERDYSRMIRRLATEYYHDADFAQLDRLFGADYATEFREAVRDYTGHDGVIVNFAESSHYIAWFPEQIKSVVCREPLPSPFVNDDDTRATYRYYLTQRPISIGTIPSEKELDGNLEIRRVSFDEKQDVPDSSMKAYGFVEYDKPLSDNLTSDYELIPHIRYTQPMTMYYLRNTVPAPRFHNNEFGQDIEPTGEYMSQDTLAEKRDPGSRLHDWEYGKIRFQQPLFIDYEGDGEGWKKALSDKYGGLTGKNLSDAIQQDGYDAIITVDGDNYSEIVNLAGEKFSPENEYIIRYGHMGNGVTVWNAAKEVSGDYETVAHISPDREVTYYNSNLPDSVKEKITRAARTMEMQRSATQDEPVFQKPAEYKPPETREGRIYENLATISPEILTGEMNYVKLEAGPGMMPLTIEQIGSNRIAMMHYYTQNGDLMRDPDMVIDIDREAFTATAYSYQQDNLGQYQCVDTEKGIDTRLRKSLDGMLEQWTDNIIKQDYGRVEERTTYKGHDIALYYNSETGQVHSAKCENRDVLQDFLKETHRYIAPAPALALEPGGR